MDVTKARLNRLSQIIADVAQVVSGSVVIPFIFDKFNIPMIILGLVTALGCWLLSYYLAR